MMKILSVLSTLLLSLSIFVSSAKATPILYEATGTIYQFDGSIDPLEWGEKSFRLQMGVDSSASPSYQFESPNYYVTDYTPDQSTLYVGGSATPLSTVSVYPRVRFAKREFNDDDIIGMNATFFINSNQYTINVFAQLPFCTLELGFPIEPQWPFITSNFTAFEGTINADEIIDPLPSGSVYNLDFTTFSATPVPEPSTFLLLGGGLLGLAFVVRRRKKE